MHPVTHDRKQELDTLWGDKEVNNQIIEMPAQNVPQAQQSQGDAMLTMIERLAANPDFDIVKMQALLDMRNQELARVEEQGRQELARLAKQEFNKDYVVMSGQLPLVAKRKLNKHTTSKYAALEDINQEIRPILSKYNFSLAADVLEQTDKSVTVEVVLIHAGGHEKTLKLTLPIDNKGTNGTANKTDIQGIASSITYAKRVAICALLNISTGDDNDGNQNTDDVLASIPQREATGNLFRQLKPEHQEKFNSEFGGIAELKKKDVDRAMARLNSTIKTYKESK